MAEKENPILEVKNLSKSFGKVEVFSDICFAIEKGSAMAVIGSSGSGKTTLLRCLNFLETPEHGQIVVKGNCLFDADDSSTQQEKDIRHKRLHFGLVFQSFNLFPQYSAFRNVTLASELLAKEQPGYSSNRGRLIKEIQERAEYLLGQVGLSDKLNNYPHELSGGQQQRVAIARALAVNPDILCFDEPTSALDPELTGEVLKVIKSLADLNTTMLIVTHEMSFARDVADTVAFMDAGSIVEQGPPSQVISNPKQARTRQFLERYLGNN
ncbi:MAG: amino acid ABC transporter ATP-binding protein [Spirochaetales bacterium]|uniref:Amino acid ABC transporter ATP-binding protein n=1 Tax=Candidatus Thalassospirochaeta sargassi TaxID=3119039 RepID=A0AAJ1MNZ9_9SPIO|nr:amino acid ABC transporter ATP-binding protein [Spirochaetales bacterium]